MKTKAILASLMIWTCSTGAVLAEAAGPRQIVVTGEARTEVAPDRATITLGVTAEAEEAAIAMRQVSEDMTAVIAVERLGPHRSQQLKNGRSGQGTQGAD